MNFNNLIIFSFLTKASIFKIFFICLVSLLLYALLWVGGLSYFDIDSGGNSSLNELSELTKKLSIFLLAPIIETLLFQALIIYLVLEFYKRQHRYCIAIVLSTLAFSLTHVYSIFYFLYAIGLGAGFSLFYIMMLNRRSYPIVLTMLLHSSFNAFGYFMSPFFD